MISRNAPSSVPPRRGGRSAPAERQPARIAPAQWDAPFDDRPSARTVTVFWSAVGVALAASLAFFGWALSVERDPRNGAPAHGPASADPSVSVHAEPDWRADREFTGAFVFGLDGASQSGWATGDGILDVMDDAAGNCLPSIGQRQGAVVRLIARSVQSDGGVEPVTMGGAPPNAPARPALRIVALEIQPRNGLPMRFYGFTGREGHHVFDETGARSCGVGWQPPLAHLRRTSRFNPKRLHPVLHRVVPHHGTDFGAAKGTPVYAAYRGTVDWVGPHGAHGNWVSIIHPDGIETGYAHLSRFAPGIKHGDRVHAHQLIGYVGSTGRSTGPHLHWSARKGGEWFDAEQLLAKGGNGVPATERVAFLTMKGNLDRRLDAIPLPRHGPAAGGALLPPAPPATPRVDLRPGQ